MKCIIDIDTNNSAVVNELFGGNGQEVEISKEELARMLHVVECKIEDGHKRGVIADSNGNRVGTFTIS